MELAACAKHREVFNNILHHYLSVLRGAILRIWEHIFHAVGKTPGVRVSIGVDHRHSHNTVVYFFLCFVSKHFFKCFCLCFCKSNGNAHIAVFHSQYLIWIEAKNILIAYTVGDRIQVQTLAKEVFGSHAVDVVLIVNRSAGKTEVQRSGKVLLNTGESITESRAVALVDDKHNSLCADFVKATFGKSTFFATFLVEDQSHFLNGGYNESHIGSITFKFVDKDFGVFRTLNIVGVSGKTLIFFETLSTEFNSIH